MVKKLLVPACVGLALAPTLASSASLKELEDRIIRLEDESLVSTENIYDINTRVDSQMTISGYTDVEFQSSDKSGSTDGFRLHHLSLFFEKNLGSDWRFFSEIEYEDAPKFEGTGKSNPLDASQGKIFLEAVNLTYQWRQDANFRFGRMFTPAGIWSVDHYPTFVPTQERPQHIRKIFPQNVDGAQAFGTVAMGTTFMNYDVYVGNGAGPNQGHGDANSTKGRGAKASFIFPALDHFELGASYYADEQDTANGDNDLTATGFHGKLKSGPVTAQFESAGGEWKDASGTAAKEVTGSYLQVLYDWDKYTFGARYDLYDDDAEDSATKSESTISSVFANYHVNRNITLKLEHHSIDEEDPAAEDYNKFIVSVVGYLGN